MSDMLSVEAALERLMTTARPMTQTEAMPADDALGRILAQELISSVTVPPHDNAAMDGYAVRSADCAHGAWLPISQRIPAGRMGEALAPDSAARIFTGAPLPVGADTVVMQEDSESEAGRVRFTRLPKTGAHIRRAGEDIRAGEPVLSAGTRLGPAQLGVVASTGHVLLPVFRRLKVAVFFTGDELVLPGHPLPPGRIYNSNRATLLALLRQLGVDILDLGQVPDQLEATLCVLEQASREADVVITTGGVSVGEEDHVKAALTRLGRVDMWKVAMKPGKPLVYGHVGEADFLGLPGNPVSAFIVFGLFVRPFLLARMGAQAAALPGYPVTAAFDWRKPGQRREFLRARLEAGQAVLHCNQSSGVLTSMAWAEGLVDLPAGATVKVGDPVRFLPLAGWLQ